MSANPTPPRPLRKARCGPSLRALGRDMVAAAVDAALRSSPLSNRQVAERLGLNERIIRDWRTGARAVHLGDVAVLPPELADQVLSALLVQLRHAAPGDPASLHRRAVAATGTLAGQLDEALRDGQLDTAEQAQLGRTAHRAVTWLDQFRAAVGRR